MSCPVLPCAPTASGQVETWRDTKASRQMNEAPEEVAGGKNLGSQSRHVTITASAS